MQQNVSMLDSLLSGELGTAGAKVTKKGKSAKGSRQSQVTSEDGASIQEFDDGQENHRVSRASKRNTEVGLEGRPRTAVGQNNSGNKSARNGEESKALNKKRSEELSRKGETGTHLHETENCSNIGKRNTGRRIKFDTSARPKKGKVSVGKAGALAADKRASPHDKQDLDREVEHEEEEAGGLSGPEEEIGEEMAEMNEAIGDEEEVDEADHFQSIGAEAQIKTARRRGKENDHVTTRSGPCTRRRKAESSVGGSSVAGSSVCESSPKSCASAKSVSFMGLEGVKKTNNRKINGQKDNNTNEVSYQTILPFYDELVAKDAWSVADVAFLSKIHDFLIDKLAANLTAMSRDGGKRMTQVKKGVARNGRPKEKYFNGAATRLGVCTHELATDAELRQSPADPDLLDILDRHFRLLFFDQNQATYAAFDTALFEKVFLEGTQSISRFLRNDSYLKLHYLTKILSDKILNDKKKIKTHAFHKSLFAGRLAFPALYVASYRELFTPFSASSVPAGASGDGRIFRTHRASTSEHNADHTDECMGDGSEAREAMASSSQHFLEARIIELRVKLASLYLQPALYTDDGKRALAHILALMDGRFALSNLWPSVESLLDAPVLTRASATSKRQLSSSTDRWRAVGAEDGEGDGESGEDEIGGKRTAVGDDRDEGDERRGDDGERLKGKASAEGAAEIMYKWIGDIVAHAWCLADDGSMHSASAVPGIALAAGNNVSLSLPSASASFHDSGVAGCAKNALSEIIRSCIKIAILYGPPFNRRYLIFLLPFLTRKDLEVREWLMEHLPQLFDSYLHVANQLVRLNAMRIFLRVYPLIDETLPTKQYEVALTRQVGLLLRFPKDRCAAVRAAAVENIMSLLRHAYPTVPREAVKELLNFFATVSARDATSLSSRLQTVEGFLRLLGAAASQPLAIGYIQQLTPLLSDPHPEVRLAFVRLLRTAAFVPDFHYAQIVSTATLMNRLFREHLVLALSSEKTPLNSPTAHSLTPHKRAQKKAPSPEYLICCGLAQLLAGPMFHQQDQDEKLKMTISLALQAPAILPVLTKYAIEPLPFAYRLQIATMLFRAAFKLFRLRSSADLAGVMAQLSTAASAVDGTDKKRTVANFVAGLSLLSASLAALASAVESAAPTTKTGPFSAADPGLTDLTRKKSVQDLVRSYFTEDHFSLIFQQLNDNSDASAPSQAAILFKLLQNGLIPILGQVSCILDTKYDMAHWVTNFVEGSDLVSFADWQRVASLAIAVNGEFSLITYALQIVNFISEVFNTFDTLNPPGGTPPPEAQTRQVVSVSTPEILWVSRYVILLPSFRFDIRTLADDLTLQEKIDDFVNRVRLAVVNGLPAASGTFGSCQADSTPRSSNEGNLGIEEDSDTEGKAGRERATMESLAATIAAAYVTALIGSLSAKRATSSVPTDDQSALADGPEGLSEVGDVGDVVDVVDVEAAGNDEVRGGSGGVTKLLEELLQGMACLTIDRNRTVEILARYGIKDEDEEDEDEDQGHVEYERSQSATSLCPVYFSCFSMYSRSFLELFGSLLLFKCSGAARHSAPLTETLYGLRRALGLAALSAHGLPSSCERRSRDIQAVKKVAKNLLAVLVRVAMVTSQSRCHTHGDTHSHAQSHILSTAQDFILTISHFSLILLLPWASPEKKRIGDNDGVEVKDGEEEDEADEGGDDVINGKGRVEVDDTLRFATYWPRAVRQRKEDGGDDSESEPELLRQAFLRQESRSKPSGRKSRGRKRSRLSNEADNKSIPSTVGESMEEDVAAHSERENKPDNERNRGGSPGSGRSLGLGLGTEENESKLGGNRIDLASCKPSALARVDSKLPCVFALVRQLIRHKSGHYIPLLSATSKFLLFSLESRFARSSLQPPKTALQEAPQESPGSFLSASICSLTFWTKPFDCDTLKFLAACFRPENHTPPQGTNAANAGVASGPTSRRTSLLSTHETLRQPRDSAEAFARGGASATLDVGARSLGGSTKRGLRAGAG